MHPHNAHHLFITIDFRDLEIFYQQSTRTSHSSVKITTLLVYRTQANELGYNFFFLLN